jgi:sodium transport system permease protein
MNYSAIRIIARKELKDMSRDRRALYALLFSSLIGPLLVGFMLNQIASQERAAHDIKVPLVGAEYAPILVNWLKQQPGVEIVPGPADPETAVRERKNDFVVVIEKDFAKKFRDSSPAPVQLFSDSTRQNTRAKVRRIRSLLTHFSAQIASMRLIARGVSPALANSLKLDEVEVSSAQQRAANVFNIIPMFLILSAFSAGMQLATDSTAGERERGSLEPLLLNPVPRWQVVAGKWWAATQAALAGMLLTLVLLRFVLSKLPLEDLGVRFHLERPEIVMLVLTIAPIAMMAPAIQLYLACFAKSFKEAQSYMAFLVTAVTIPGILSAFYPITNNPWMHPIPILGQYAASLDILGGKIPSPVGMIAAAAASLALVVLFLWLATKSLSSEKIIFGR